MDDTHQIRESLDRLELMKSMEEMEATKDQYDDDPVIGMPLLASVAMALVALVAVVWSAI